MGSRSSRRGDKILRSTGRGLGAVVLGASVLAPLTAVNAAPTVSQRRPAGNPVLDWNRFAGEAACIAPMDDPLHESRMYALAHLAMHDALNAIDRRSRPYALWTPAPRGTSADAAVAAAARGVLVRALRGLTVPPQSCIDAGVASVEAHYTATLRMIPGGAAKSEGLALGRSAARAVLAKRTGDGSDTTLVDTAYRQGHAPGQWRFTPDRPFAFAPGWRRVTPFALRSAAQFRPEAPYALRIRACARDPAEVQRLGGDGTTTPSARSADQTETALFWLESSPLMWNAVARRVAVSGHLDAWESARLFGLLDAALADGYVASFNAKYVYRFWRPVTAIRLAGHDGGCEVAESTTDRRSWPVRVVGLIGTGVARRADHNRRTMEQTLEALDRAAVQASRPRP